ncbi:MAG: protein kinase [Candidatus Marithrix sp.]
MMDRSVRSDTLKKTSNIFNITDKLLGHGSYGTVYSATDENNNNLAIKCCNIDKNGIPNILETSIMNSIIHPYLNSSVRIQASDSKLYIIQEAAKTDLLYHTKKDKNNHRPSITELRKWCFSIASAVECLHNEDIIHADIKSSNILLYQDDSVKLTDFTLSTKHWDQESLLTKNVCTSTHRPLECLLKKGWDKSLDIWSLGCTFYEIAYGELLFPYQGSIDLKKGFKKDKDFKVRLRKRSVNAILDWQMKYNLGKNTDIKKFNIDFISPNFCELFKHEEYSEFNNLLMSMLKIDGRITIKEVLSHPFMNEQASPNFLVLKNKKFLISKTEKFRVSRYIQKYTNNKNIQVLAMEYYLRCINIDNISEIVKACTVTWIASKVVINDVPKIDILLHQILAAERDICHNLEFRLHIF